MSFCDFKGIWWVTSATSIDETKGHRIAIGGTAASARIFCIDDDHQGKHPFPKEGLSYQVNPEQINLTVAGGASYKITLNAGKNELTCEANSDSGLGPGSWTAEDNPGGDYGPKHK